LSGGRFRSRALWVLAVALMLGFLWWGRNDLARIRYLRPLPLVLCFIFTLGIALTSVSKWRLCLKSMGECCADRLGSLFYYFMVGRVLGLVIPMEIGDFSVRTMSLKMDHRVSIGRASYSVYLDRTFDVIVSAILLVPSGLFILRVINSTAAFMIAGAAFLAGYLCFAFFGPQTIRGLAIGFGYIFRAICHIPGLRGRVDPAAETRALVLSGSGAVASTLYLLSGLKFLWTSLRFASVALAIGLTVGIGDILLFAPGAQAALVFSVTPGGLGVVDWSWSGLLYRIGVDRHDIVPYLITMRVAVLVSVLVIAGFSRIFHKAPALEPDAANEPEKE